MLMERAIQCGVVMLLIGGLSHVREARAGDATDPTPAAPAATDPVAAAKSALSKYNPLKSAGDAADTASAAGRAALPGSKQASPAENVADASSADAATALSRYQQRRDPSDEVAKILNYAVSGNENGRDGGDDGGHSDPHWSFFIKESNCVYRFVDFYKPRGGPLQTNKDFTLDFLHRYTLINFQFMTMPYLDIHHNRVPRYTVLYDNIMLFGTTQGAGIERIRQGFNVIFSKYCPLPKTF